MRHSLISLVLVAVAVVSVSALDNGLAITPQMGYNT